MKLTHPKLGTSVNVDNRRDEIRLKAHGYREPPEAPKPEPKPEPEAPVMEQPVIQEDAPKPRSRSRKTESE